MRGKLFCYLLFCFMVMAPQFVEAAPANPEGFSFEQPSGETFNAKVKGDEFFNYVVTDDGEALEQGEDGFWYYLQKSNSRNASNKVSLSKAKVGIDTTPSDVLDEEMLLKAPIKEQQLTIEKQELPTKLRSSNKKKHNLLVLLVEFDDIKLTYSDADWRKLVFGETAPSLKEYYKTSTNDAVGIEPATETEGTPNDGIIRLVLDGKHPDTGQKINIENQKIVRSAFEKADKYIDYKQYDTNKNGRIESDELHFMIIVAGQEQSYGNVTEAAVWGHRWALNSLRVTLDNAVLDYFTQFGEKHAARQATLGIIAHEFGHDIGLPDLYNTGFKDENGITTKEGYGLGYTSLMSNGSWGALPGEESGSTPVGLDAYSKALLGADIETITTSHAGKLLQSLEKGKPTILKINSTEEKEYFLIENRQLTGYDAGMKRGNAIYSGGIAIYKINQNYSKNQTAGKQLVTILEADEKIRGYSNYESGSLWRADPFYYVGQGIHKQEQQVLLAKSTTPSTILENGIKENFSIEINSPSSSQMFINLTMNDTNENIPDITKIAIKKPEKNIVYLNSSIQLEAIVYPDNASQNDLVWESANNNVATVKNGLVTGKNNGIVTITAKSKKTNEVKDSYQVVVTNKDNKTYLTKNAGQIITDTIDYGAATELFGWNKTLLYGGHDSRGSKGMYKITAPETGKYRILVDVDLDNPNSEYYEPEFGEYNDLFKYFKFEKKPDGSLASLSTIYYSLNIDYYTSSNGWTSNRKGLKYHLDDTVVQLEKNETIYFQVYSESTIENDRFWINDGKLLYQHGLDMGTSYELKMLKE